MEDNFKNKYLKYKLKYEILKNNIENDLYGGGWFTRNKDKDIDKAINELKKFNSNMSKEEEDEHRKTMKETIKKQLDEAKAAKAAKAQRD